MNNDIDQFSIHNLLSNGKQYIIPIYQRNYAWGEGEITQLIQDILDYLPEQHNYYIGTLVVFERLVGTRSVYETIDGQQRLTTLSLLASYLKNDTDCDLSWYKELVINFDSREKSQHTFSALFNEEVNNNSVENLNGKDINTAILNGYNLIKKILPQKLSENRISVQEFSDFLFKYVQIIQVKVPKDTDLNHYFEIMNNRGEQLEKHEILKSQLMEILKDDKKSQYCFHLIWEACANMEKYVQMGFPSTMRSAIFATNNWDEFKINDFEELKAAIYSSVDEVPNNEIEQTLDEIIRNNTNELKQNQEEVTPERFHSVITFPHFLLHVLRVQTEQNIPLDDKRLISTFEYYILKQNDVVEKVKNFIFDLLRCKFLYDQYIIKREYIKGADGWSLKRLAKDTQGSSYYKNTFENEAINDSENKRILMLLAAFHVSTPTLAYKHWLSAVLYYLFITEKIFADNYLNYLESTARAFVFDRFLSKIDGLDYFEIIFTNKGVCQTKRDTVNENNMDDKLSFGKIENNFIFNFLDYLLWVKNQKNDNIIKGYEFSFRSSVEHYYPQTPLQGFVPLDSDILNSFGNLCLISHSKNSRLSNFMPEAKKEYYQNNTIDSVKQYFMMKAKQWNEYSIKAHSDEMKSILLSTLESTK